MLARKAVTNKLRGAMRDAGVTSVMVATACGISEQAVSQWFSTGKVSTENLAIAARLCGKTIDELLYDEPPPDLPKRWQRTIPVISTVEAGLFTSVDDPYPVGFGDGEIPVELLPVPVGPSAFGLRIKGDSMREEYYPGDIVVIDPLAPVRPSEPVVAKRDEDDEATFKIYHPRGNDDAGNPIIELLPINAHFPPLVINAEHPGRIIGPMVARIHGRRNAGRLR